jgi:glutamine amidotransferase-like uncharacterized protein
LRYDSRPYWSNGSPIEVTGPFVEAATVSETMTTRDRSTVWRRAAGATIILAALALCSGGVCYLAWDRTRPAPSPRLDVRGPIPAPEALPPVLSTGACWPVPQPEARELIGSLQGSTAATRAIRVGIFSDRSCCDDPEPLKRILASIPSCTWELVTAAETQAVPNRLGRFDVIIFPGGGGHRQANALGYDGRRAVRDFVHSGGGYVGICAGAFLATAGYEWSLGLVNTRTLTGDRDMPGAGIRPMAERGAGTVRIELTREGRALFADRPGLIDVSFSGGPVFLGQVRDDLPPCVPLAYYRTEVALYAPQRGTMIDTPSILAARYGAGRVVAISPHPEATSGLEFLVKRSVLATARKRGDHPPATARPAM